MSKDFDRDYNDLHGGYSWADAWQTVFFTFDILALAASLTLYLCFLKALAKQQDQKLSVINTFILFYFMTLLVDLGLILESFMSNYGLQTHSTAICQFVTFVTIGNRILQGFTVLVMLYFTLATTMLKRQVGPKLLAIILVLLIIFKSKWPPEQE